MNPTLTRRIENLEHALAPATSGPCFIMAPDHTTADREIERLQVEHGDRLPRTLFVMTCADAAPSTP